MSDILAAMKPKPTISLIGAGRLALALAPALHQAGYVIDQIVSRNDAASLQRARELACSVNAAAVKLRDFQGVSQIVWLCVGDAAIAACAAELARAGEWKGRVALHSSGALASDELAPLRRRGARVGSLHPLMTFVHLSRPSLSGVGFAVEGDAAAVRAARGIVLDLGGESFAVGTSAKPLYHAWGAFGSPLLVMELALAERVAQAAGLRPALARRTIAPLVRRTVDNYFAHGPAAAFSGPLVRGDVETVRRHLKELAKVPGARGVYVALAKSAMKTLPVGRRRDMERLLK